MDQNQLPALRYPDLTPTRAVADLGQISGEAYQHVGRYAGAVVVACFEQIGGLRRMADWADQNPTDFYTKLMPKLIQRSTQVDVSGTVTIDDAISRLESQPMNADYSEVVEDAEFYYDL
jgi:hypothetical protein